jgi:hypothetical protein
MPCNLNRAIDQFEVKLKLNNLLRLSNLIQPEYNNSISTQIYNLPIQLPIPPFYSNWKQMHYAYITNYTLKAVINKVFEKN